MNILCPDLDLAHQGHFERFIRRKSDDLSVCYVIAQRMKHHTPRPKVDNPGIRASISSSSASILFGNPNYPDLPDAAVKRAKIIVDGENHLTLFVFERAKVFWMIFLEEWDIDREPRDQATPRP